MPLLGYSDIPILCRGIRHRLEPRGIRITLLKAGTSACRQYGLLVPDQAANLDDKCIDRVGRCHTVGSIRLLLLLGTRTLGPD